jgi:hypothetical protein
MKEAQFLDEPELVCNVGRAVAGMLDFGGCIRTRMRRGRRGRWSGAGRLAGGLARSRHRLLRRDLAWSAALLTRRAERPSSFSARLGQCSGMTPERGR